MICLTAFPTKDALLEALEAAGLAHEWDGERHHDATCVDVFPVWPRKLVDGEWVDDTAKPEKWVANLAMDTCPASLTAYQDFPSYPRRVFAG